MLVPGILGFHCVVVGLLLVLCLVIRQKWRNAAERKEEVTRLLFMASQEAAMVEAQAVAEHSCYLKPYQCAVCFCPTTTRCSRCKSVRYCSGKCQIIHWRQGHKDECHPSTDFATYREIYSKDSGVEGDFKASPKASLLEEDEDGDGEHSRGVTTEFVSSSASALANTALSDDFDPDMPRSAASPKKTENVASRSSGFDSINHLDNISNLNKNKLVHCDGEVGFRMQLGNNRTPIDDVHPTKEMNKSTVKEASSEMLVAEASTKTSLLSSSHSQPHSVTNYRGEKNVRYSSCNASSDHQSSAARGHLITRSKSVSAANCNGHPSLPQNACNGLKTSMQKVVQQFRAPPQSKPYLLNSENEVTGKYNCKIIFPYELFVELYTYDAVELRPFGLTNCGNSCYANAVIQILAFTRPLTSYLVRGLHSRACQKDWCFICEFECLILKARNGDSNLSPIRILSKIQQIGSHLARGKEEDAHEFLRYVVDAMQFACLKEAGAVGPLAEETSLVGLTFGGYLHSKITCMKCHGKSERYEQMMDLTVEIDGDIASLHEALAQFTGTEILDGDNKYHCSRCKSYVKAKKKLTVLEAPNILTIVLKRFQSGSFGKLNKLVHFPEVLDMGNYMSGTSDKSPVYNLYAVVVHLDVRNTAFSGHYVCYVKDFHGDWYKIDDSTVDLERVLLEGAYMLLYARQSPRVPAMVKNWPEPHGVRSKKRDLEPVPFCFKTRPDSHISNADSSKTLQKHGKHPYRITSDGTTSKHLSYSEDWRFHPTRRIPSADSWSESSSLFSSSDTSSCSTTSTKDSVRNEDFSDYLFGDMGPDRYGQYGMPSGRGASTSYQNFNVDSERDWRKDLEGGANPAFLYSDSTRHHRRYSSSRETDFEQVGQANPFSVRLRRASGDRPTQTFY